MMTDRTKAGFFAEEIIRLSTDCDNSDSYGLQSVIRKAGHKILGAGCYGFAVAIPDTELVLKVAVQKCDGYTLYAKYAMANPRAGFPKVQLAEWFGDVFLAIIPRLSELTPDQESVVTDLRYKARNGSRSAVEEDVLYLYDAIVEARNALGSHATEDMHAGNFMFDEVKQQYVLTDPFSSFSGDAEKIMLKVLAVGQLSVQPRLFAQEEQEWECARLLAEQEAQRVAEAKRKAAWEAEERESMRKRAEGFGFLCFDAAEYAWLKEQDFYPMIEVRCPEGMPDDVAGGYSDWFGQWNTMHTRDQFDEWLSDGGWNFYFINDNYKAKQETVVLDLNMIPDWEPEPVAYKAHRIPSQPNIQQLPKINMEEVWRSLHAIALAPRLGQCAVIAAPCNPNLAMWDAKAQL